MRLRLSPSLLLAAGALLGAGASPPAAPAHAAPAATTPPAATPSATAPLPMTQLAPPDTGYYLWRRVSYRLFNAPTFLWPDATIRGFYDQNNASLPWGPGIGLALDPVGGLPLTADDDRALPPGSLHGRSVRLDGDDRPWNGTAVAVDGSIWTLEGDGEAVLVQRDENLVPRSLRRRPGLGDSLVVTRDGLRIVDFDPYRRHPRVLVFDRRMRVVARVNGFRLVGHAVTARGRLILIGRDRMVELGGTGRVRTLPAPGGPRHPPKRRWWFAASTPTRSGPAVVFGLGSGGAEGTGDPTFIGRLDERGRVLHRRSLARLGIPELRACTGKRRYIQLTSLQTAPSGNVLLGAECLAEDDGTSSATVVAELGPDLLLRQLVTSDPLTHLTAPLPDGRLGVIAIRTTPPAQEQGAGLAAITLPDALPVERGRVLRVRTGRATGSVIVRLRCQRPEGAVCSGIVTVRSASGATLGWAPYALPGRPGWAPAIFDRTVELTAAGQAGLLTPRGEVPAGATATLAPLPAQIDRTTVQPPAG